MFDFAAFRNMADDMIGSNGVKLKLVQIDGSGERTVTAWESYYRKRDYDGELVMMGDRRFRVQANLLREPDPETERLRVPAPGDGEKAEDMRIINVDRKRDPNGSAMFYVIQVRSQ